MARPRLFDEDRALEAAMRTFWANGYEATSTQDLCEATGLGRSSIYNTFSSKHDLFMRALVRYIDTTTARQLEILDDAGHSELERIRALLGVVVESELENRRDGRSPGCLTVNTVVELAGRDAEAAQVLDRDGERRLNALRMVIESGQRSGSITSTRDAAALAAFVNAVIGGMRIASQAGAGQAALASIAETAVDALTC
ncbi:TetR/AcrR family transcriptional regulator [Saccharopolyspora indica]|uniref:TetR/AcrR family transcriptional regulator n=1 Tax=Saccharopolyspora indica TaxID=1229659 RepID=UPI0022EA1270|nr:TetR/AcrR family transcriptional regulator [Saccharopolyspora indica]MDA3649611.1 TetR/AcrR family transcriptional regulator [Saccharopolyspora indica]